MSKINPTAFKNFFHDAFDQLREAKVAATLTGEFLPLPDPLDWIVKAERQVSKKTPTSWLGFFGEKKALPKAPTSIEPDVTERPDASPKKR